MSSNRVSQTILNSLLNNQLQLIIGSCTENQNNCQKVQLGKKPLPSVGWSWGPVKTLLHILEIVLDIFIDSLVNIHKIQCKCLH